jgi:type 1 glutamine amidotransferase
MPPIKALVFGGGQIHDWRGIQPQLVEAIKGCAGVEITTAQEDLSILERLDPYDVLVFHYTVGSITDGQRDSLSHWVASGKGFVGIHSAADSFRDDPDFRNFIGGYFVTHPRYRDYQVSVAKPDHPIMKGLEEEFVVKDEQYILDYDPRVEVLATALWKGKTMPVVWTKPHGKGRVCYIALGHDPAACQHPNFRTILLQAVSWSGGVTA